MFDITILTDKRYLEPNPNNEYKNNVFVEDDLLKIALEQIGYSVYRTNWDNKNFDWRSTKYALFRTTWDYFNRFKEFSNWLEKTKTLTTFIHDSSIINWNIDKHYLLELKEKKINVIPSIFIKKGETISFERIIEKIKSDNLVLKPCVSGAGRHTYLFNKNNLSEIERIFNQLILEEDLMLQPYQKNITNKGEVAYIIFNGLYSHAIHKMAKKGEFRVQDDFGGTISSYSPSIKEINFAESVVKKMNKPLAFARVDVIWDNNDELCVSELELIEPELWLRNTPSASHKFATSIKNYLQHENK